MTLDTHSLRRSTVPRTAPALGYIRSLPGEPTTALRAQSGVIRQAISASQQQPIRYELVKVFRDEAVDQPSYLSAILAMLKNGHAEVLLVTRWDRIAVSNAARKGLRDHSREYGWTLQILDEAEDGTAAGGGSLRSTRTVEGLAEARGRGARLGRPRRCPDDILIWVSALRAENMPLAAIADLFNRANIPTPGGGPVWYPPTVLRLLRTQDAHPIVTALQDAPDHDLLRTVAACIQRSLLSAETRAADLATEMLTETRSRLQGVDGDTTVAKVETEQSQALIRLLETGDALLHAAVSGIQAASCDESRT